MPNLKLFSILLFLSSISYGAQGISQPPVWNPFGGHLQYLGPGDGLKEGEIYYLYKDGSNNVYYTFDGESFCLYVNSIQQICYGQNFLLLEDGTIFLLEDGTGMLLE